MTRRRWFRTFPKLSIVLALLAIFISSLCTTPSAVHAKRVEWLGPPGGGGGSVVAPGQGDDDQPTVETPTRRSTVSVVEPTDSGGGSRRWYDFTDLGFVKRLFTRGRLQLRRLVHLVP